MFYLQYYYIGVIEVHIFYIDIYIPGNGIQSKSAMSSFHQCSEWPHRTFTQTAELISHC